MVEHQPSKLNVASSTLVSRSRSTPNYWGTRSLLSDFVVSDTKFIRANMEVIEAEMNTVMQELAKLDTQLGLREIEEETEGDFGIVEEEEEDDDDDNGMDGSMDEDTQNFKRMR